jgi:hypothetical protein
MVTGRQSCLLIRCVGLGPRVLVRLANYAGGIKRRCARAIQSERSGRSELFQLNRHLLLTFLGKASIDLGEDMESFGISRDGQWVAYRPRIHGAFETNIEIQPADQLIRLEVCRGLDQVVWGPVGWRVRVPS